MKYKKKSTIESHDAIIIVNKYLFFGDFCCDNLRHIRYSSTLLSWSKIFVLLFPRCAIVYHPYSVTMTYTNFRVCLMIHIDSMVVACCELIECFHDIFLSLSEILSSIDIIITAIFKALFERTIIQRVSYLTSLTELESIVLSDIMQYEVFR